jgi:hypothetical protein
MEGTMAPVTRRDFLKDMAFAAALVGLPQWAMDLDEPPTMEMMTASSGGYPWPWRAPADLGTASPVVTVLNRIAFGPRPGDFERVQAMGIDAFVEEQLHPEAIDDSILEQRLASQYPTLSKSIGELLADYPQQNPKLVENRSRLEQFEYLLGQLGIKPEYAAGPGEIVNQLQEATVTRAIQSERQLQEVLVDFWSNHFSIYIYKNADRWLKTVDDREVIRKYAFGKFEDLLLASARSPAMLEYLDNRLNVKGVPNENYAREIMELHTLGVDGGYTQKDVQELARCFTGWTIRPPQRLSPELSDYANAGVFVFNPQQHDDGTKQVLGMSLLAGGGIGDAEKMISVLAHHPSTAHFISKKLVMRLVADTPPDALVQRAAETFQRTDGDIRAVLSTILHSDEFKNSFAQKVKRPFELVASTARALDLQLEDPLALALALRLMGQGLFQHQSPDGYPDSGTAWINTGGLLARWNFALLVAGNKVPRAQVDLPSAMSGAVIHSAADAVDFWINRILHRTIPDSDRSKLIQAASRAGTADWDSTKLPDLVALILASPHFQYR